MRAGKVLETIQLYLKNLQNYKYMKKLRIFRHGYELNIPKKEKDAEMRAKRKDHKLLQFLHLHSAWTDDHTPVKWKAHPQLAMQPHTTGDVKQQPLKAQIHAKHCFTVHALATLKTSAGLEERSSSSRTYKHLQALQAGPVTTSVPQPFKHSACHLSVSWHTSVLWIFIPAQQLSQEGISPRQCNTSHALDFCVLETNTSAKLLCN